jgi:pSer/pThr/pTyr-binding forkhead associated (FHA) protein
MDDPIAIMLKFGFLAVLYLFLLWVARSALRDVSGGQATALIDDTGPTARPRGMDLRAGVFPQLEVVAAITLGRSPTADLQVDDPFASSVHARIFPRGEFMYIEDMGSTNGTFLNGRQLRKPEQLKVADSVRIGDTEYRYQE